jgi:hypothetical protein
MASNTVKILTDGILRNVTSNKISHTCINTNQSKFGILSLIGGIFNTVTNSKLKYTCTNIHLSKSNFWKYAVIDINNIPISTIDSSTDIFTDLVIYNDTPSLLVNNMIVWQQERMFNYNVTIHLNGDYPDVPYASFLKYDLKQHSVMP